MIMLSAEQELRAIRIKCSLREMTQNVSNEIEKYYCGIDLKTKMKLFMPQFTCDSH